MIIKELKLENIRSHEATVIEFAEGKTLIQGDIGSGKSSIMMSIEAALFGIDANKLIRKGKDDGIIELTFEIKDDEGIRKKYTVIRKLSKKKTKGYLIYHNEKEKSEDSIEELSRKITKILNISGTTRAQESLDIFNAFVHTKQDELKELVKGTNTSDIKNRNEILRKAFEMEAYEFANHNVKNLIDRIKAELKFGKGQISGIGELEKNRQELSEEINKKKINLENIKKSTRTKEEKYNSKKKEYNKVKEERTKIITINTIITNKKIESRERNEEILANNKKKNEKRIKIEKTGKNIEQIKSEIENLTSLEELRNKENKLTDQITHLKTEIKLKENEIERYEGINKSGKCTECGRKIDDISGYKRLISTADMEKEDIKKEINKLNNEKMSTQKLVRETTDLKILEGDLKEMMEIEEKNKTLNKKILKLNAEVEEERIKLEKLSDEDELKKLENELKNVEEEFRNEKDNETKITTEINVQESNLKEKNTTLEKLEQKKLEMEKLEDINEWLKNYFMTTVELIEEQVIHTLNYKFNELFKEWFELLVDDTSKTVRVDEKFTPVIEQSEFQQTFEWLSGGEKAGIALAYRLALNSLIRQQPTGFRPELLMLDEPTDGFSKEQLTKVSNILSDIENKQVIIVSHNQEFIKLDQIISVTKENDISKIHTQAYGD